MEFNGIKFFNGEGYKLSDALEDEIEELIKNEMKDVTMPIGSGVGRVEYRFDMREEYVDFIEKCVPVDLKDMKIVVDCAEGASHYTSVKVLREESIMKKQMSDWRLTEMQTECLQSMNVARLWMETS